MSVGVAIIGAGRWGPHLVNSFQSHPDSHVHSVVEIDRGRQDALRARFPDVLVHEDFDSICQSDSVDAVVVATPSSTHFRLVKQALESDKHVLVEKPLATSLTEAAALAEMASETERVVMVGHVFLFNPAVRAVKEMIKTGELGKILYMSMLRTNLGPVRLDTNAAWDLAAHDVSIANYWLDSSPTSVSASGGSYINPGVEDVVFATAKYPDGAMVHIHASWLNPRKSRFITVVGDRRMATVNDMDLGEPLRVYDRGVVEFVGDSEVQASFAQFRSAIRDGAITIPPVAAGEPLAEECDSFLRRILGKPAESVSDVWDGLEVVRVLDGIERSIAAGSGEVSLG